MKLGIVLLILFIGITVLGVIIMVVVPKLPKSVMKFIILLGVVALFLLGCHILKRALTKQHKY